MKFFRKKIIEDDNRIIVKGDLSVSVFRREQNRWLKKALKEINGIKNVLNVGANRKDPDKEGMRYIDYFNGMNFYTLDKNKIKDDENHYNADLLDLSVIDIKFDLILLMSTLEHVENPFKVVTELGKILNPRGYVYVTAPFFYPIHKSLEMGYSDYWRFTDDALRMLFSGYEIIWINEMPSVIVSVNDRKLYWEREKTLAGYCALFRSKTSG